MPKLPVHTWKTWAWASLFSTIMSSLPNEPDGPSIAFEGPEDGQQPLPLSKSKKLHKPDNTLYSFNPSAQVKISLSGESFLHFSLHIVLGQDINDYTESMGLVMNLPINFALLFLWPNAKMSSFH